MSFKRRSRDEVDARARKRRTTTDARIAAACNEELAVIVERLDAVGAR